jgi:ABC-2 type transport system permease protein
LIEDLATMIWKEWKEFFFQRGTSRKWTLLNLMLPIFVLGFIIPLRVGAPYVQNPGWLVIPGLVPLLFVLTLVADSFAGERERHTLETLLASRLSDQAILLGKIAAAVLYAFGVLVLTLLLGLVAVNLSHSHGQLLMFPMNRLIPSLLFDFLAAVLLSCVGVFVSLRAATVRQAMQTLNFGFMIVVWGSFFGLRALPAQWQAALASVLAGNNLLRTEAILAVSLVVLDAALLIAARARFRRARLILD